MEFLLENILNLIGFIIGIIIGVFAYVGYKIREVQFYSD